LRNCAYHQYDNGLTKGKKMNTTEQWTLVQKSNDALAKQYGPVMAQSAKQVGLPEQWAILWVILEWEPDAISDAKLQRRNPYSSMQQQQERLDQLVVQELLQKDSKGEYRLTESARSRSKQVIKALDEFLGTLEPLPAAKLQRLETLLQRVVEATVAAPEPPGKEALLHNRNSADLLKSSVTGRVVQYLTDLAANRDESHLAAWQPYRVGGAAWEAFTFVWNGEAASADELNAKLQSRGRSASDYAAALKELAGRGWIAPQTSDSSTYQVTQQGKAVRQEVENLTNRYFYAPWTILNANERDEFEELLTTLLKRADAAQPTQVA
jgi:hypothetical protein